MARKNGVVCSGEAPTDSDRRDAIVKSTVAWQRSRGFDSLSVAVHEHVVPVTGRQWCAVLDDSSLISSCDDLYVQVTRLSELVTMAVGEVGRSLFGFLDAMMAAYVRFRNAVAEVRRFDPPSDLAADVATLDELGRTAHALVVDVVACVGDGLDERRWEEVVLADALRCTELVASLFAEHALGDGTDPRFERALGLSTAAMTAGDGMTFATRLLTAWARHPELDERLYAQLPHLLDPEVALTDKVRVHLAAMHVRAHPLPTHAAAMAARDLVLRGLTTDMEGCLAAIGDQVSIEADMLFTHRKFVAARTALAAAEHEEDQVGPALDMYLTAVEGSIRRTARLVLQLLGRQIDPKTTLGQLVPVLAKESTDPMCSLLLAHINTDWRNAIAHSQVRWDPMLQKVILGDEPVEPSAVADAAEVSHELCTGFDTGLAIALNHAGNPHVNGAVQLGHVGWEQHVMRSLGQRGIEATEFRRYGTTFSVRTARLTIATLRDTLVGFWEVGQGVPDLRGWRIMQDGSPDLVLDEQTLATAVNLSTAEARVYHPDAVEIVLCTGALMVHGASTRHAVDVVIRLATSTLLGERDRMARQLRAGDDTAFADLTSTLRYLVTAVYASVTFLDADGQRALTAFAWMLANQHQFLNAEGFVASGYLRQLEVAFRSSAPLSLPWLEPPPG